MYNVHCTLYITVHAVPMCTCIYVYDIVPDSSSGSGIDSLVESTVTHSLAMSHAPPPPRYESSVVSLMISRVGVRDSVGYYEGAGYYAVYTGYNP